MLGDRHGGTYPIRLPEIPIPLFSGTPNERVSDFIENFENWADIYSYDDKMCIKVFRFCLRDEALKVFNYNKTEYTSFKKWEEVKEKLIEDFEENTAGGDFLTFYHRIQLPSEKATCYVRDKLELLRRSKIEVPEKDTIFLLMEGLLPHIKNIVQMMKPKTLSDFEEDLRAATNSSLSLSQVDAIFPVHNMGEASLFQVQDIEFQQREHCSRGTTDNYYSTNSYLPQSASQLPCDFVPNETENIVTCLNLTVPNNQVFRAQNEYPKNDEFELCLHNRSPTAAIKLDTVEDVRVTHSLELPKIFANFKVDLETGEIFYDPGNVGAGVKEGNASNSFGAVSNLDEENIVRTNPENGQNINQVNEKLSGYENFDQGLLDVINQEVDIVVVPFFVKPGTPECKDDTYSLQADENYFEKGSVNAEAWCLEGKNVSYKEYSREQKNNSSLHDQLENGHNIKCQNNETSKLRLNELLSSSFEVFYRDSLPSFENMIYRGVYTINESSKPFAPNFSPSCEYDNSSLQKGDNLNWKFRKKSFSSCAVVEYFFKLGQGVFAPSAA